LRVYVCRRDYALTQTAVRALIGRGHFVVGCAQHSEVDIATLKQSGADLYLFDRYMHHPDGETLKKSMEPRQCVLIDGNLDAALKALESYADLDVTEEMRECILHELMQLGFRPHTRGVRQLMEVLSLVVQDERRLDDLSHRAYPIAAKRCGVTWQCVERNIRYAIETVWTNGDIDRIQTLFGYTVEAERGKPTNKAFLAQMAEHIRMAHA